MFAEQIIGLIDLVGGVEHADVLLEPLELLLGIDETAVRNAVGLVEPGSFLHKSHAFLKAVKTTKELIKILKRQDVNKQVIPMLVSLAGNSWFSSKMSACALMSCIVERIRDSPDSAEYSTLKETYFNLCSDDTPMVRRAAAKAMGEMALVWPSSQRVVEELVPCYNGLLADMQESVRLAIIEETVKICQSLAPEDKSKSGMVNQIKHLMQAPSWHVRLRMVSEFAGIAAALGSETTENELVSVFLHLLRDPEGEVRSIAVKQIVRLAELLQPTTVQEKLLPAVSDLVTADSHRDVTITIAKACVDPSLIKSVGDANVRERLLPIWEKMLKGEFQGSQEARLQRE